MAAERPTQSRALSEQVGVIYLRDPYAAACEAVNDLRRAQESVKAACDRLVQARAQEAAGIEDELTALEDASHWLAAAERRATEIAHASGRFAVTAR